MLEGGSNNVVEWNTRRFPLCPPFYGHKGVFFDRFEQDFKAAIADEGDQDAPLTAVLMGRSIG